MDVLVLNSSYQPVSIVTWQKAIIKLHAERATERVEVVATYPDRFINSAHIAHPMPSVVRHVKYRQTKKRSIRFGRDTVWARDQGRCQYCGIQVPRHTYTYDHVIPRSRGGKTDFANIVTACNPCNNRKRDRTPDEAGMKLRSHPKRPDYLPEQFRNKLRYKKWMPPEWKGWFGGEEEIES